MEFQKPSFCFLTYSYKRKYALRKIQVLTYQVMLMLELSCFFNYMFLSLHRLIVLLALLVGVLYSLHLLVKDYQALTAPRLLRFLFKRDISSQYNLKPDAVRWKAILRYDPIQCARYLYCDLGARPANNALRQGFVFMLSLEPSKEHKAAWEVFRQAYQFGKSLQPSKVEDCRSQYSMCPFHSRILFDIVQFMVDEDIKL